MIGIQQHAGKVKKILKCPLFVAGNSQEKLSEQFQIDCGCCGGCGGGQAKNVIDLVVERGSPRQADYPYLGHNGKL